MNRFFPPSVLTGTIAERPAVAVPGQVYVATDLSPVQAYMWTGEDWLALAGGSSVSIVSGSLGNWQVSNGRLYSSGIVLDADRDAILVGGARSFLEGTGVFLGLDGSNGYVFRVGNPDGSLIKWDGQDLTVSGTVYAGAGQIGGWTIAQNHLYAGSGSNRAGLRPADYPFYAGSENPDSAPFSVSATGNLRATSATISGSITASAGSIAGWTIASDRLYATNLRLYSGGLGTARIEVGTGTDANTGGIAAAASSGDIAFWSGARFADRASAPFRVTQGGALTSTSGTVGGWTITASNISSGNITLDPVTPAIRLGNATGYLAGTGIWMGNHGGTYKVHIGNPAGDHMRWDGNELYVTGTFVGGSDIAYTKSDSFTINQDGSNVTVELILHRAAGGPAVLSWDGSRLMLDRNLTIANTAPSLTLQDQTGGARSLLISVDNNVAEIREASGSSGSLLYLDLTNNRVGLGTSSIGTRKLYVYDAASTSTSRTAMEVYVQNEAEISSTAHLYGLLVQALNRQVERPGVDSYAIAIRGEALTDGSCTYHRLYGGVFLARSSSSAATDQDWIAGAYGLGINDGAGNISTAIGNYALAYSNASGNISNAYGVYSHTYKSSSSTGNISNAFGVYSQVSNSRNAPDGVITTGYTYHGYITKAANANDFTTVYGLRLQLEAGQTRYGLYCTGEHRNYLSSSLGIGTTNPQYGRLEVRATTGDANTGITVYDGTNPTARSWIGSSGEWHLTRGTAATNGITILGTGRVGIGEINPQSRLHVVSTTEQLRLGYDSSRYATFTVSSTGALTIAPTGNSLTLVSSDLVLQGSYRLYLRSSALSLHSSTDGQLDLDANVELELTAPTVQLVASTLVDLAGHVQITGNLTFGGARTIRTTTGNSLTIQPADNLVLDPDGNYVLLAGNVSLASDNWASGTTGWGISYSGTADFRSVTADSLHVRAFVADIYQASVGALIVTRSRARLSRDFVVPANSSSRTLYLEDLEGWPNIPVFSAGDFVLLRVVDTSGGGLVVTDVWGQVSGYTDLPGGEQSWNYEVVQNNGATGKTVYRGAIALDYGSSSGGSRGVWEATVLDQAGAPYSQVASWTTNPWTAGNWTTHVRLGNLSGISGAGPGYGLWAGQNTTSKFILLSDSRFEARGLDFRLYDGAVNTVRLDPSVPSFAMGATLPTGYQTGDGVWMGKDGQVYRFRVGDPDGELFAWDGQNLLLRASAGNYLKAAGSSLEFYASNTLVLNITSAPAVIIGNSNSENIRVTSSSVQIRDGNKVYADLTGDELRLGEVAGGEYIVVSPGGIGMYGGGNERIRLNSDGSGFLANNNVSWNAAGNLNVTGSATIAGWTVSSGLLSATNLRLYSGAVGTARVEAGTGSDANTGGLAATTGGSDIAFWAGATFANRSGAPFRVTAAGALTATNASITGSITANSGSIAGWTIASGHLYAGSGSGRTGLRPADYPFYAGAEDPASAPFRVTPAGALTATNATVTGTITANAGSISGWTIASGQIHATNLRLYSGAVGTARLEAGTGTDANTGGLAATSAAGDVTLWAGATFANRSSAPFRVTAAGALTATNATITGTVTADAGSIGGWTIASGQVHATNLRLCSGAVGTARLEAGTGTDANTGGLAATSAAGDVAFWAGATFSNRSSAPFRVTAAGALVATNANITGVIDADSGNLGNLLIDGVLTIATSGGLYQGTGSFSNPTSGLRLSNDGTFGRLSLFSSGAEVVRLGNLNGNWGYTTTTIGLALGEYASNKANLTWDPTNGLRLRTYTTTVLQLDNAGNADITGKLRMPGSASAIAIGATPPTGPGSGTGIWIDRTGFYSLKDGTYQVKVDATNGKLYAAGGDLSLSADGIVFAAGDLTSRRSIRWLRSDGGDAAVIGGTESGSICTMVLGTYEPGAQPPRAQIYLETNQSLHQGYIRLSSSHATEGSAQVYVSWNGLASSKDISCDRNYKVWRDGNEYIGYIYVPLASELANTNLDGDPLNTGTYTIGPTGSGANFEYNYPAAARAVTCRISVKWTSASDNYHVIVRHQDGAQACAVTAAVANIRIRGSGIVGCNSNGVFVLEVLGANASFVALYITGYFL